MRRYVQRSPAAGADAGGGTGTVPAGEGSAAAGGAGAGSAAGAAGNTDDQSAADKAVADSAAATAEAAKAKADADAAAAAAAAKVVTADKLKLPEGFTDATLLERTAAIASAQGLTPEQAQVAVDLVASEVAAKVQAAEESMSPGGEAWTQQVEAWKAKALEDPSLGTTPEERIATMQGGYGVVEAYAKAHPEHATELRAFLDNSGLGNHPVVVGLLGWIYKEVGKEGTFHLPQDKTATTRKSDAEVFYENGGRGPTKPAA